MCKRLRELAEQLAKIRKEIRAIGREAKATLKTLQKTEISLRSTLKVECAIYTLRHADDDELSRVCALHAFGASAASDVSAAADSDRSS